MMVGRADGPRFEASQAGVRLIGFSSWPEPRPVLTRSGLPRKPSYAERVEAAALEHGRDQRMVVLSWDDITRIELRYETALAGPLQFRQGVRLAFGAAAVVALLAAGPGTVSGSGGGGAWNFYNPWTAAPQVGVVWFSVTTAAGTWVLDAPIDDARQLDLGADTQALDLLKRWMTSGVEGRHDLPETWPTGVFRPGLT